MSVRYRVRHITEYAYTEPVSVCHNMLCVAPTSDHRQRVESYTLTIDPTPTASGERQDAFGNVLHVFSIERAHTKLVIDASSEVVVDAAPTEGDDVSWEDVVSGVRDQGDAGWLAASPFVHDSEFAKRSDEARAFAAESFTAGRPIFEAAMALTSQIHSSFKYQPGATQVHTDSGEALRLRSGVCQDFAHVGIAGMRALGVPVRYVSGYLRTIPPEGQPRLVGADQSHAWYAVYCGAGRGWVDFDPTNDCLCGTDHITLAAGRDYADVAPVRGVFLGGGASTLRVTVDVEPLEGV